MRKSTTALKLALGIWPDFKIEQHMAIGDPEDYMRVIKIEPKHRGEVRILDEAGVGVYHRNWFEFVNKSMSFLVQTFGYKGLVTIVVAPFSDLIDKDLRKFFDYSIQIVGRNEHDKYVVAKVMRLEYNQDMGKIYHKYLHAKREDGKIFKIVRMKIGWPDEEHLNKYFELANVYKKKLEADIHAHQAKMKIEKVKREFNPQAIINDALTKYEKFINEYGGRKYVQLKLIQNEYGLSIERGRQVKVGLETALKERGVKL